MNWAGKNAAAVFKATGEAGTLTLRPETAGGTPRTYENVKRRKSDQRQARADGGLQRTTLPRYTVPRVTGAQEPAEGEHAKWNGGAAGVVASINEEHGFWIVEAG